VPVRSELIVDDSPAIRKVVCELFASESDFEVCGQAENGREAVEKAKLLHADNRGGDLRSFRCWSDRPPDLQEHTHHAQG
jgi:CheY-like chemotaxis protein